MASHDEATGYPTADLELAVCPACGFITNPIYNPAWRDYGVRYEETQGYSKHFSEFLEDLADRMIARYGLRGKTVLEIGCGKGEFLALLCRKGDNRGIAIDPACIPQRIDASIADRITVIQDYYGPKYAHLQADVIICRHTLEHIPKAGEFLRLIRQAVGSRRDVLVFFEVPETLRLLREGAFWDVYYEHCSYFTPGSLGRLFRSQGFQIDDLYLDFADQYILLMARPTDQPPDQPAKPEEPVDVVLAAVDGFRQEVEVAIDNWRRFAKTHWRRGERTVVWQSGSKAVAFLTTLQLQHEVQSVVDINPHRQGKFIPLSGHRIIAPADLAEAPPDFVIAMNPIYRREIQQSLGLLQLHPVLLTT